MKSKLCSSLLAGLVLLLIASVVGCGECYTQEDLDVAYERGQAEGYDDGYEAGDLEGYKVGYAKGKDAGLAELEAAKQEASKVSYDKGYEDGHKDGLTQAQLTEGELSVHFIDVGQGDSILVDLGETEILIDGGDKSSGIVEYLKDFVDEPLEVMVATHPHADHIGGLIGVLDAFEVDEIWLNGDTNTSQTYTQFRSAVNSEGAQVYEARRGDTIIVGELTFNVLHPVKLSGTTNNNSIVLSLSYGEIDFLFTGDAEQEAEASMLMEGIVPDVEILKVGHHGSRSSSSTQFLDVVKPEVAIYMAGEGNSYGHPHQETITALAEVGAEIYGTDIHGTIIITTKGYSVQCEIPCPPSPVITNLSISPDNVEPGETVTISATVTNSGGSQRTHTVTLKINGSEVETKSVVLNVGEGQVVSFTVARESAGTYAVEVNGSQGTFTVDGKNDLPLYVGSINSNVYHYPSCRYAQRIYSENEIWFSSVEDAKAHGYRPCKVCKPPG